MGHCNFCNESKCKCKFTKNHVKIVSKEECIVRGKFKKAKCIKLPEKCFCNTPSAQFSNISESPLTLLPSGSIIPLNTSILENSHGVFDFDPSTGTVFINKPGVYQTSTVFSGSVLGLGNVPLAINRELKAAIQIQSGVLSPLTISPAIGRHLEISESHDILTGFNLFTIDSTQTLPVILSLVNYSQGGSLSLDFDNDLNIQFAGAQILIERKGDAGRYIGKF